MHEDKLIKLIKNSVRKLYKFDKHLIEFDAHERSITAKLACYMSMSTLVQDYHVDCEYNRNIDKPKRTHDDNKKVLAIIIPKITQNTDLILPDIIIHKRGNNENNILVVEIKKVKDNLEDINKDFKKLTAYVPYNYKYIGVLLLPKEYNNSVCLHKKSNVQKYQMTEKSFMTIKNPTFIYSIMGENKQEWHKNTMENINEQKISQKITFAKQLEYKILSGEYVKLQKLQEQDMITLYDLSHNTNRDKEIWNYTPQGPFDNMLEMSQYYQSIQDKGSLVFCVHNQNTNVPIGILCLMDIQMAHGSIEFGGIWYAKDFQGTKVNTEAIYLLLKYCIDELGFRRVVWKCDDDNQKSKNAAVRLGFTNEGLFKDHMIIVKNNLTYNRNTAWYRLLAKDWRLIKQNYTTWLYAKVWNSINH